MNKRIRSMIDEIFADMKMTAENLALRDELMANAQARYEDAMAQGKSEEDAFAEVAASLDDVQSLLQEMNARPAPGEEPSAQDTRPQAETPREETPGHEAQSASQGSVDLGNELNKAFSALGNMFQGIGRAVDKGMKDAQRVAGETIDRLSGDKGEITIDFGKHEEPKKTPGDLREEAKDLRAQAAIKRVSGDTEGAMALYAKADELETQAEAIEQAQAMEDAQKAAQEQADAASELEDAVQEIERDVQSAQDDLEKTVEEIERDVQDAVKDGDAGRGTCRRMSFPAAGLRNVDIQLDADDVRIVAADGDRIEAVWTAQHVDGEPSVTMDGHTLTIRRRSPDVFKTFFSVFTKDGGELTVRVPRGYAADYKITTTSGDVRLSEVDVETVEVSSTSGDVRLEPDASVRAKTVKAGTVSGAVTVSACAGYVSVNTVSGDQYISCDANKVDANAVSGKVHIEGACEEWRAGSVSGNIELLCTVAPTGKVDVDTLSGSARVALPADIRGFVADLSGISGKIVNEFGPNRYGTCALPIHMDTMSGTLIITRL